MRSSSSPAEAKGDLIGLPLILHFQLHVGQRTVCWARVRRQGLTQSRLDGRHVGPRPGIEKGGAREQIVRVRPIILVASELPSLSLYEGSGGHPRLGCGSLVWSAMRNRGHLQDKYLYRTRAGYRLDRRSSEEEARLSHLLRRFVRRAAASLGRRYFLEGSLASATAQTGPRRS
jgi:hypothetical protein